MTVLKLAWYVKICFTKPTFKKTKSIVAVKNELFHYIFPAEVFICDSSFARRLLTGEDIKDLKYWPIHFPECNIDYIIGRFLTLVLKRRVLAPSSMR